MATVPVRLETPIPTEKEAKLAEESVQRLSPFLTHNRNFSIQIVEGQIQSEKIVLPTSVLRLLVDVLQEMAQGNSVTLIPTHSELTTQEAADFLHVSRPYLIRLLEEGQIPFHKVGSHRRIYLKDVKEYNDKIDSKRYETLAQLVQQAQELNMGYD